MDYAPSHYQGTVGITRYQVYLLANAGVSGKYVGVLHHGLVGWRLLGYLEDASPLGEVTAVLLVLGTSLRQCVKTLCSALFECARQTDYTSVHLDAWNYPTILNQEINELYFEV